MHGAGNRSIQHGAWITFACLAHEHGAIERTCGACMIERKPCAINAWWLAGVRDWEHGWLKVLKTSGDHVKEVMKKDLGVDVEVYQPHHDLPPAK